MYGCLLASSVLLHLNAAVDLNDSLPAGYSNALANGIDGSDRIFGTATVGGIQHAVMWVHN